MLQRILALAGPHRLAVSALFMANGLMMGSWAPKLPALMQRLEISSSTAGLIVLCLGVGTLLIMPVFGAIIARHGSARSVRISALLLMPMIFLMSLSPNLLTVALTVLLFGGFIGGMDVAMNANAVAVERQRKRAIMSSCHGFWSLGGAFGSAVGGLAISRIGEVGHSILVIAIYAGVLALAFPRLLQDPPPEGDEKAPLRLPRSPLPYIIGFMALCSMVPEGAILDWAAVYLERDLGASASLAGWGFAACALTMSLVRFLGDFIRQKLGAVSTLRISAVIAMTGMGIAGMANSPMIAIIGFGTAGLGIANMVPIAFSAAGNLPGMGQGIGLSVVTMMGYSGILLAPSGIGFLAEVMSFSVIYLGMAALLVVPLLLSPLARFAEFNQPEDDKVAVFE